MLRANPDRFTSYDDIREALREEGLRKCSLMFAIDYTMSNKVQGEKTFGGKSLHDISENEEEQNPYQEVISVMGEMLQPFDEDGLIPTYGFGDKKCKGDRLFYLKGWRTPCVGFRDVLNAYNTVTPNIELYRPTNFAPVIDEAIEIVKRTKKYHILVICADGQVNNEDDTANSIVEASKYPLSIIVVGVGDGPWGVMREFDDRLPKRQFDNFQFFDFHDITSRAKDRKTAFALHAMMEIPDQYRAIKELGLLDFPEQEAKE